MRAATGWRRMRIQRGRRARNRLGRSRLKEMSIGRVCICGQTRAPRANCSSTRAMARSALSGTARVSNSGEKVVGMSCLIDSSASWSMRAMVMSVA